jgi:hypothetical protein
MNTFSQNNLLKTPSFGEVWRGYYRERERFHLNHIILLTIYKLGKNNLDKFRGYRILPDGSNHPISGKNVCRKQSNFSCKAI